MTEIPVDSNSRARLEKLSAALLEAVGDIREHLAGPPASDAEVRSWPLVVNNYGVWCGDADCNLQAENSEIGDFWDTSFTLAELHEAVGHHIAARREREEEDRGEHA